MIALVTVMLAIIGCGKEQKEPEITKIGMILPLTGDTSPYGTGLKRGVDIALAKINAGGGINGSPLSIVVEDGMGDPSKTVSAFRKLSATDQVPLVIGPMFSATTLAVAPIAEKSRVTLLSPTASAVELTSAGDYIFRIYPSDTYDGQYLAQYCYNALNAKTVYVIYLQVASVTAITEVFESQFESLGGRMLGRDAYQEGANDYRAYLSKAAALDPDVMFIPGYLREMGTLLRQAKELGVESKFVSISTFFDPQILEIAGDAAEGVMFSAPFFDPSAVSPEISEFVRLFKESYSDEPDILAGYGYDVVTIAAEALRSAKSFTADDIKSALYGIQDFPGVTGKTSFDENGDVNKELRMMQVKQANFVPLN
jgi:branched-chain amino acid transport system substrate-binding protein